MQATFMRGACGGLLAILLQSTAVPMASGAELATLQVQPQTQQQQRWFDGVLEAENQATISSQVSARIVELPYDVDDYVEKGAVIVRFRDVEARAGLEKADASLRETQARFTEADAEFKRVQGIYERKLISKAELDRARANLDSAKARLAAAQASRQQAQEALDNTVVRAPYSGVVVARHVEVGELASPGQPLMTGRSLEHLRAAVDVPQQFIQSVRDAKEMRITLPAGETLTATSVRIFPWANERSHTFRVRLSLPEGQHGVYPGMLVKVAVDSGTADQIHIPATALLRRGEIAAVYVQTSDGWTLRQVRAGSQDGQGQVSIYAGLDAGEVIAQDPIAAAKTREQKQGAAHE